MENTNDNMLTNEAPTAKKKWETPELIFISSGDVQGGSNHTIREASFTPIGGGKYRFQGSGSYGASVYNQYVS